MRSDRDLDFHEPKGAPHVLELWRYGRDVLSRKEWAEASRLSLFTPGEDPEKGEIALQRSAFVRYIEEAKPRHVLVIPTPEAQLGEAAMSVKGTQVWTALRAPDSLDSMRGTWWRFNEHTWITALYPMAKRIKEMHRWQMANWIKRAARARVLLPPPVYIEPGEPLIEALRELAHKPLAVDLEFIPSTDKVTAVGLSDGVNAVSVPWDDFKPAGSDRVSYGIIGRSMASTHYGKAIIRELAKLLAGPFPKYAHNFVADIPRLRRMGFVVNGAVCDTFAAHAIAFPEARHALQLAAASLLAVPPWKSLYKPRTEKYLNKDDEDFWTCDPQSLRVYNAKDAFYTWHLAQAVLPYVEIDPLTGGYLGHEKESGKQEAFDRASAIREGKLSATQAPLLASESAGVGS